MEQPRGSGWVGGVNLFIFRGGVPVATARVRDAHRRGLSIETRYTGYRLLQALELCLTLGREQGACAYRFAPLVSRRGRSGLGLTVVEQYSALPLFLVAYQTINFHHYIVDGLIWKVRKKPLRANLGLES